jgi:uncharacterized NAD(P)/FAD-binding protein YdhS
LGDERRGARLDQNASTLLQDRPHRGVIVAEELRHVEHGEREDELDAEGPVPRER